jgi:microcin C transport system substrate-binding protein
VRIELGEPGKENMLSLFSLPVMPEKFWKDHKLSDPLSPRRWQRPYRITDLADGTVRYLLAGEGLLGADLPVNRGRWNFDTCAMTIISTTMSPLKPLKPAPFDMRTEGSAKNWATRYIGSNFTVAISSKMSSQTPPRRIPVGWRSISSARCLPTAGYVKPSPWPLILSG